MGAGESGDVGHKRENGDAVERDRMARFCGGNEVEFGERGKQLSSVLAELQFGVVADLNRREVPHTGEQSGDIGG